MARYNPLAVISGVRGSRFHVHVAVDNLGDAIGFYAALFAAQPPVVKPDDAKWMLDDACCGPQAEPKLQAASARCTS